MDQLTPEQAAIDYNPAPTQTATAEREAFKAGAQWHKEQLKAKWEAMSNLMENGLAKDLVNRVAAQLLQD